jgi:hypothetical protein
MLKVSEIEQLLRRVFDGAREGLRENLDPEEYAKRRRDFVFHMTDWSSDLEQLGALLKQPDRWDNESASAVVIGFLYHVIPHLNAAGKLLLDEVGDPFAEPEMKPG